LPKWQQRQVVPSTPACCLLPPVVVDPVGSNLEAARGSSLPFSTAEETPTALGRALLLLPVPPPMPSFLPSSQRLGAPTSNTRTCCSLTSRRSLRHLSRRWKRQHGGRALTSRRRRSNNSRTASRGPDSRRHLNLSLRLSRRRTRWPPCLLLSFHRSQAESAFLWRTVAPVSLLRMRLPTLQVRLSKTHQLPLPLLLRPLRHRLRHQWCCKRSARQCTSSNSYSSRHRRSRLPLPAQPAVLLRAPRKVFVSQTRTAGMEAPVEAWSRALSTTQATPLQLLAQRGHLSQAALFHRPRWHHHHHRRSLPLLHQRRHHRQSLLRLVRLAKSLLLHHQ
jgi:hypothetical protein